MMFKQILEDALQDLSISKEDDENSLFDYSDEIVLIDNYKNIFDAIPEDKLFDILKELFQLITSYKYYGHLKSLGHENHKSNPEKDIKSMITTFESSLKKLKMINTFIDNKNLQKLKDLNKLKPINADIVTTYETLKKLIDDLENKKFELIPKDTFYKYQKTTKTDIKKYLERISKEFNLKKTKEIKNFVDSFNTP